MKKYWTQHGTAERARVLSYQLAQYVDGESMVFDGEGNRDERDMCVFTVLFEYSLIDNFKLPPNPIIMPHPSICDLVLKIRIQFPRAFWHHYLFNQF